jgi:hypothetical protein
LSELGYATRSGLMRSTSLLIVRLASQRSTARCAFIQNSGALPNSRERRSAISGLTARRPRRSSFTDCRDTPAASASAATLNPKSGRKSSRSISPGWVGRRVILRLFGTAIAFSCSVVVTYFDVVRVAVDEPKTNTPLIVDGDGVLSAPVILQRVQSIPRRHAKILDPARQVDVFQFPDGTSRDIGRKAFSHSIQE